MQRSWSRSLGRFLDVHQWISKIHEPEGSKMCSKNLMCPITHQFVCHGRQQKAYRNTDQSVWIRVGCRSKRNYPIRKTLTDTHGNLLIDSNLSGNEGIRIAQCAARIPSLRIMFYKRITPKMLDITIGRIIQETKRENNP